MNASVSRRQFLELSGIVAAGLGLAGCGGSGDSGSGSGSADGAIKVGIMGPYSGSVAQYGIACRDGALLWFKQLNADGGINGKQVETNVQDEKGDATEAVSRCVALARQPTALAATGRRHRALAAWQAHWEAGRRS